MQVMSCRLMSPAAKRLDVGLTICRRFAAGGIRWLNRTACYGAATPCGGRRKHIIPYLGASPEAIETMPRIRGAPARKRFWILQHAFFICIVRGLFLNRDSSILKVKGF